MRIQFNNITLVVEENNYANKTVNACIIYDLDNWSKNLLNNLPLNNFLFHATNIVKHSDKSKYVYSGYRITFDEADDRIE